MSIFFKEAENAANFNSPENQIIRNVQRVRDCVSLHDSALFHVQRMPSDLLHREVPQGLRGVLYEKRLLAVRGKQQGQISHLRTQVHMQGLRPASFFSVNDLF